MKIHVPYSIWLGSIENFLRTIDLNDETKLDISFDPKWLSLHPVVFSIIGALGLHVDGKFGTTSIQASGPHLKQLYEIGLYEILKFQVDGVLPVKPVHENAGKCIPLTQIKNRHRLTEIIQELVPLLHCSPEQADPIKYVLSEMIRNVMEHSRSPEGAIVCAKYLKKSNRITIGIADCGIGIKESLNRYHNPETHAKAIRLALTPGITGTTSKIGGTEYNAGAGLFFTKSIAKVSNNFFILYSGDALYRLRKDKDVNDTVLYVDPMKDNATLKTINYWQGTVVGVDISLDNLKEFNALLSKIREAYFIDIKSRKKEFYKKPKFID